MKREYMKCCIGCDCIYFDDSRIDAFTGRNCAYCKKSNEYLKIDYENKVVYAGKNCDPIIRVIRFANGDVIGAKSWIQY